MIVKTYQMNLLRLEAYTLCCHTSAVSNYSIGYVFCIIEYNS